MRVPLLLLRSVVADVDLAADDRLDALLARVLEELDRPGERPVIGEPDGGHLELGRPRRESGNAAGPVENRELGVDVQVDEVGGQRTAILGRRQDAPGFASGTPSADLLGRIVSRHRSSKEARCWRHCFSCTSSACS